MTLIQFRKWSEWLNQDLSYSCVFFPNLERHTAPIISSYSIPFFSFKCRRFPHKLPIFITKPKLVVVVVVFIVVVYINCKYRRRISCGDTWKFSGEVEGSGRRRPEVGRRRWNHRNSETQICYDCQRPRAWSNAPEGCENAKNDAR